MKGNARLQPFFQVELTADTYIAECDEKKFVIYENAERLVPNVNSFAT